MNNREKDVDFLNDRFLVALAYTRAFAATDFG